MLVQANNLFFVALAKSNDTNLDHHLVKLSSVWPVDPTICGHGMLVQTNNNLFCVALAKSYDTDHVNLILPLQHTREYLYKYRIVQYQLEVCFQIKFHQNQCIIMCIILILNISSYKEASKITWILNLIKKVYIPISSIIHT